MATYDGNKEPSRLLEERLKPSDPKTTKSPKARSSSLRHKIRFSTEQSEESLRQLLEDFENGKLNAFGDSNMLQKMKDIREMQEKLTLKHFEIDQSKMSPGDTASGTSDRDDAQLTELIQALERLGSSIQSIHSKQSLRKPADKRVSLKSSHNDPIP